MAIPRSDSSLIIIRLWLQPEIRITILASVNGEMARGQMREYILDSGEEKGNVWVCVCVCERQIALGGKGKQRRNGIWLSRYSVAFDQFHFTPFSVQEETSQTHTHRKCNHSLVRVMHVQEDCVLPSHWLQLCKSTVNTNNNNAYNEYKNVYYINKCVCALTYK